MSTWVKYTKLEWENRSITSTNNKTPSSCCYGGYGSIIRNVITHIKLNKLILW